ncbi:MAG: PP2C family serine/threonine-protein phosphatase [Vicinamibacterales bacterium]
MRVSWAAATHPGTRRPTNEDSFCAREDLGLFVVADGMGGHAAGEVASRVAVDAIESFVAETEGDKQRTWPMAYDLHLGPAGNRLKAAFSLANRQIGAEIAKQDALSGMATTAVAVLVAEKEVAVAHVGDSRGYRLHAGTLSRLTRDHSWVEEQVQAGVLSNEAAREHPWRNIVTRALAGGPDPVVDLSTIDVTPGDRLLLCSDGLSSVIPDDRIGALLAEPLTLQRLCERLVELANAGGGPDNVTVLALEFHDQ